MMRAMVKAKKARLTKTRNGLRPAGDGWFVLNAASSVWYRNTKFGATTSFEGAARFAQYGINLHVLMPGQPNCHYHGESDQEDFLVLSGECLVLIAGREIRLRAWDFVHCPPGTDHVFVGAGKGPCAILMTGARSKGGMVHYPRTPLALRHGAGVEVSTDQPRVSYAGCPPWAPANVVWPPRAGRPKHKPPAPRAR